MIVKTKLSKNNKTFYVQERKGSIGTVMKHGMSNGKLNYYVQFKNHCSWIDVNNLIIISY